MKRNSLLTAALVMFILGLMILNKAFAANNVPSTIQGDHEECIVRGFHMNISK